MSVIDGPLSGDSNQYVDFSPDSANYEASEWTAMNQAAAQIGATWQDLTTEIGSIYGKCKTGVEDCFTNMQNELLSKYQTAADAVKNVTNTLKQELVATVNATTSQTNCGDSECDEPDIPQATCPVMFGQIYGVRNVMIGDCPNPWKILFPDAHWADKLPEIFYLDNNKTPTGEGGQVNCDYSVTVGNVKVSPCETYNSGYNDNINPPWPMPKPPSQAPVCIVDWFHLANCAPWQCCPVDGLPTKGSPGGPPNSGDGGDGGYVPPPDNGTSPPPGSGTNPCCPPQQIVVPAPIVNVTFTPSDAQTPPECPPCEPSPDIIIDEPAPEVIIEPIAEPPPDDTLPPDFGTPYEPPDSDFVKEVMYAIGFTGGFIDSYGDILDGEELLEDMPKEVAQEN